MRLAIIGAGMAGLAAAQRVRALRPDATITVIEKSRGVGGRAATRRSHGAIFDHGAQYIKAPSAELEALVRSVPETLVDIALPVWTFDHTGTIAEGDAEQNREAKWIYSDGITRLAKHLARDLDIRFETRAHHLAQADRSFLIIDHDGTIVAAADAVLLTAPAPQSCDIIAASSLPADAHHTLMDELDQSEYRPCLTITLGYPPIIRDRPFYALVNTDRQHPISWLAYEHRKPGRDTGGSHLLIAQMAPNWSRDHWDDPADTLVAPVAALIRDLLKEDLSAPVWSNRQGWRYALPDSAADFEVLNSAVPGLFFAGDFTAGQGRVHRAIEEGWRVAERIARLEV